MKGSVMSVLPSGTNTNAGPIQPPAEFTIRNRFSLSRLLLLALSLYILLNIADQLLNNPRWQWGVVWSYMFDPRILKGLQNTIILTFSSTALGLLLGAGVAAARLSRSGAMRATAAVFIWITRAIPGLVLLLFIYFLGALIPMVGIGVPFGPAFFEVPANEVITRFSAAVIGLAVYLAGHVAEIFRSGMMAIPRGQFEACSAIGMGRTTANRVIIFPQVIRVIIPPMANELITMFKSTSLVSVIGYAELLTTAQLIYSVNFETIPLLTVACIYYLAIASAAMVIQDRLEKHFGKGYANGR